MARIRTVKPEFWRHEGLSELPEPTHMLAAALLNYADDEGYFNANQKLVKAECCPLREPSVSIHDSLTQLSAIGYITLGTTPDGKRYGRVNKFLEHQRINRPTESKIRKMAVVWEDSPTPHTQLTEPSPPEGKGREGKGMEQGNAREGSPDAAQTPPPNPATAIIDLFDKTQAEIFNGERRAFPAGDDIVFAKRWSEAGVDLAELGGLFRARLQAKKSAGERTIGSLKFLDGAVADLMARKKSVPKLATAPPRRQRPQPEDVKRERDEQLKRFSETKAP